MCLLESTCDLNGQTYGLFCRQGASKRFAIDVLHDQIVRADVVELANVGMIQRRNRAGLALETIAVLTLQALDGDYTIETRITRLPYLAHAACANRRNQHVGVKPSSDLPGDHPS